MVISKPSGQAITIHHPLCHTKNKSFRLIHIYEEFNPIEHQYHFHSRMADSLVAINKRMVLDQCEAQTGNFLKESRIKILTAKRLPRLSKRSFQQAKVSDSCRTTGLLDQLAMKLDDFSQAQPTHQARRR